MLKKLFNIMALVMAVLIVTPEVEAKRFGGGKSWGKSQPTFKKQPSQQLNQQQSPNSGATSTARRPNMMGGLLGGLLAGGLFAALLGGGAFEGLQMMDILLFALIAFVAVRFLRGLNQQKAAAMNHASAAGYPGSAQNQWQQGGFASASQLANAEQQDIPFNPPAGFDSVAFLDGARGHFDTLQRAWNDNNLSLMQEYLSIDLYNALTEERRSYGSQEINSKVLFVDAELVRADHSMLNAEVSVKFTGRIRDEVSGEESELNEVWHLERRLDQDNAPWLIVGIEA